MLPKWELQQPLGLTVQKLWLERFTRTAALRTVMIRPSGRCWAYWRPSGSCSTAAWISDLGTQIGGAGPRRDLPMESILANRKLELGIPLDSGRSLGVEFAFNRGTDLGGGLGNVSSSRQRSFNRVAGFSRLMSSSIVRGRLHEFARPQPCQPNRFLKYRISRRRR